MPVQFLTISLSPRHCADCKRWRDEFSKSFLRPKTLRRDLTRMIEQRESHLEAYVRNRTDTLRTEGKNAIYGPLIPKVSGQSMSNENRTAFLHRTNESGVFESACPACFEVVSKQVCEADLAADEGSHLCQELILNEALEYFRSEPVSQTRKRGLPRSTATGRRTSALS
jgi:hypothetical protein